MAKKVGMDVFILLDRSGSMITLWKEAVGAINGYVEELLKDKANDTITLATFDSNSFDVLRDGVSIKKWESFKETEVHPRGMTPLYDSFSKLVTMALEKGNKKTAIVVMTDGYENASKEVNHAAVKNLVDKVKGNDWQMNFLGANFDALPQAAHMGIGGGVTMSYAPGHAGETLVNTARLHSTYRSGVCGQSATIYSAEDRVAAGEDEVVSN